MTAVDIKNTEYAVKRDKMLFKLVYFDLEDKIETPYEEYVKKTLYYKMQVLENKLEYVEVYGSTHDRFRLNVLISLEHSIRRLRYKLIYGDDK